MTETSRTPKMPGAWLLSVAARVFDDRVRAQVFDHTIADLRVEWFAAATPFARLRARWLGGLAFWRLVLIAPFVFRNQHVFRSGFWRIDMTLSTRTRLVLGLFILGLAGGGTYGALQPTRYQSTAILQVIPPQVLPAVIADLGATNSVSLDDRLIVLKQRLLSRSRLEPIIVEMDLYAAERQTAVMNDAVDTMRKSITITPDDTHLERTSPLIRVSFEGPDPESVLMVTERLAALLKNENLLESDRTAYETRAFLEAQVEEYKARLAALTARQDRLTMPRPRELELEVEVTESFYKNLLTKRAQAQVRSNIEEHEIGQQLRLIDPARKPERPIGPSRLQFTLEGGVVGLGLAAVISLVLATRRALRVRAQRLAAATTS